jgi:acetoin utilization deacetylase AcuC-like enzyme
LCRIAAILMKAFCSDQFVLPLPVDHRFPMRKYARLRERVSAECREIEIEEAPAAGDDELVLVHDPAYVARVSDGLLTATEQRSIGFPWSRALAERARRSVGATIAACRAAAESGVAANLAGGTHHAKHDAGAGYCVYNDVAVAARVMQSESRSRRLRIAIIDLDVHQGDGTAQIFAGDDTVFTLSIHAQSNYPARKAAGDLDIALPDRTGDAAYLAALDRALAQLAAFDPQRILYVSGADPHGADRLGRLNLTLEGLAERDRRVFDFAVETGAPLAVTMAGGYGHDLEGTVAIHLQTLQLACSASKRCRTMRAEHA